MSLLSAIFPPSPPPRVLRPIDPGPLTEPEARKLARELSLGPASALQHLADTGQLTGYLALELSLLCERYRDRPYLVLSLERLRLYVADRLHLGREPGVVLDARGFPRYECEPCPHHRLDAATTNGADDSLMAVFA